VRKVPIGVICPAHPLPPAAIQLESLPAITSNLTYTTSSILESSFKDDYTLHWHTLPCAKDDITPNTRPVWLHQFATYHPDCRHTKFLHKIFLQVSAPFANHWRPVTRGMVTQFYRAIKCSTAGLAISVRLYLGPNEVLYDSESDGADSVSIT